MAWPLTPMAGRGVDDMASAALATASDCLASPRTFSTAEMLDRIEGSFGRSWCVRNRASRAGSGFRAANSPTAAALDSVADFAVELRSNAPTALAPAWLTTYCRAEASAWVRVIVAAIGFPAAQ